MRGVIPSFRLLEDQSSLSPKQLRRAFDAMAAGTMRKSTRPGRFKDLDEILAAEVAGRFSAVQPLRVHDFAAGNAITSVELFERLLRDRPIFLKASDLYDRISVARRWGLDFIFDAQGTPIQLGISRLGIRPSQVPQSLWGIAAQTKQLRNISLFHPCAVKLASASSNFILGHEDFNAPEPGPYDVVRLMNGTPAGDDEAANRAITALKKILTPNGFLFFGRHSTRWAIYEAFSSPEKPVRSSL